MFSQAPDLPIANKKLPLVEAEFMALDLELTSLDTKKCDIVAIGLQPFTSQGFALAKGRRWLLRTQVGQSATIHQTTDHMLTSAPHLSQVLPEALLLCSQKVIVVHNRFIEQPVLARVARQLLNWQINPIYFDTMAYAMKKAGPHKEEFRHNDFTLATCRNKLGLPAVSAHDALVDAQATSELCLAQMAQLPTDLTIEQAWKHFV